MKTTLLIMAAGLGSRYGGNKQVDRIGPHGEMLMQYSIYDAVRAGFSKLVFIIKPEYRELIEDVCKDLKNIEVEYVYQDFSSIPAFYKIPEERTKPFGTVHAALCAKNVISEPFAVINADDFYGAEAYETLCKKLVELKEGEAAMVAYKLKNTVSKNGAVTRGICSVSDGLLTKVTETYKIVLTESGDILDDNGEKLDGESLVSMNMWGFLPSFFGEAEAGFNAFLRSLEPDNIRGEYALPTLVDDAVGANKLKVHALYSSAEWFGVTYKEDRPLVAEKLVEMHGTGKYPEKI